jgi:hypothetical protein
MMQVIKRALCTEEGELLNVQRENIPVSNMGIDSQVVPSFLIEHINPCQNQSLILMARALSPG